MREFITLIQTLSEAKSAPSLVPGELNKDERRFTTFIDYIKNRKPFTTLAGDEVIIDPREAKRFQGLYDTNMFRGQLKARTTTGEEISLNQLAKTSAFGGAAKASGESEMSAGKEALLVKPGQIGICDRDIPASDFYDEIVNNPVLNSTDYGKVIIQLAEYIRAGEYVMVPPEYQQKDKEKVLKAIIDYGGEYLGVLALLYNRSRFPKRAEFTKWMGGNLSDLVLNFPGSANNNIADSYANIRNSTNEHTLNISSKGTGGGAAPAVSGLQVPEHINANPKYSTAVEFINLCKEPGTIAQAFKALDIIFKSNPKSIDKKWHSFLPFSTKHPNIEWVSKESLNAKKNRVDSPLPKEYRPLFSDIKSDASEGGKLIYAVKKEVIRAINDNDAIPAFKDIVLDLLEMNFIQQYADYKKGEITFATQWPAKLDGQISVESKSSAKEPSSGGFSFKLGRSDSSVSHEPNEPYIDGADYTIDEPEDLAAAAQDIVNPTRKAKETEVRKKRK
jgi:hypothetical protein